MPPADSYVTKTWSATNAGGAGESEFDGGFASKGRGFASPFTFGCRTFERIASCGSSVIRCGGDDDAAYGVRGLLSLGGKVPTGGCCGKGSTSVSAADSGAAGEHRVLGLGAGSCAMTGVP